MNGNAASNHCLLVTHLPLTDLRRSAHGTFRRLRLIAQSMQRSGYSLVIVSTVPAGSAALATLALRIEADLREVWTVEAKVRLAPQGQPPNTRWLLQQLLAATGYSRNPSVRLLLSDELYRVLAEEVNRQPQFIVAHRLPSMFALTHFRGRLPRVYFDMDDVEHVVWRRELVNSRKLRQQVFIALALPALMLAERRSLRTASKSFVCSVQDARYLSSLYSTAAVEVLPNAATIPEPRPQATGEILLMVGAYTYGPNADGANFFIEEIFPLIRAARPSAELWLAGVGCEALQAYPRAPANVRFLGFVDDLEAIYVSARVVVCPIRSGGGTRVKLIEAAAWGKPIVTTTLGAEGLGMRPDQDALFADEAAGFAAACVRLIGDDALCDRLGTQARALAVRDFDREQIIARLSRTLQGGPADA